MSKATLPSTPPPRAVLSEQVRTVGLATRRELLAVGVFLFGMVLFAGAIALLPGLRVQVDLDIPLGLNPEELGYLAVIVALFFPLAVWKGEATFGDTQLWRLPVDRPRHLWMKVGAGWVWLMAVVAAGLVAIVSVVHLSGGTAGTEGTRLVVVDPVAAAAGGAAGLAPAAWVTPWWQWVMPFTAATAIYLLASTVWLSTAHPWRLIAGGWILVLAFGGLVEVVRSPALDAPIEVVVASFDRLVSTGAGALRRFTRTADGELVRSWHGLPSFGAWLGASVTWIVAGLAGIGFAAFRHREG